MILISALVVAGRVAQYSSARQQRRLTISVVVSVELERHVTTGQRHQPVGLIPGDHRSVVADTDKRDVVAGLQRQRSLGRLHQLKRYHITAIEHVL